MTSIRVLEAITPSRIGGAETFVVELCRRFPELGAEVTLFCPSGRRFVDFAQSRGLASVAWKTTGKFDPLSLIRLARLIESRKIDVVHTHLSTASLLGALAARLAGRKSVAHVHGLNSAFSYRFSHKIIAVSEAAKRFLCAQGIDRDKVVVVHNGVDLDRFVVSGFQIPKQQTGDNSDVRKALGWDERRFVFGVFGRLCPEKGQRTAIEALFLLNQQRLDAELIIVGDGPDRSDLESFASALGIADRVRFTGFVEDVRELMSACEVVAAPSLKEGFGLVAVEAMALQRPVIASDVGGLPEIVVPGETGFLFAPEEPAALAQALSELAADPLRASSMGSRGRQRVEERFDLDNQLRQILGILGGLVR